MNKKRPKIIWVGGVIVCLLFAPWLTQALFDELYHRAFSSGDVLWNCRPLTEFASRLSWARVPGACRLYGNWCLTGRHLYRKISNWALARLRHGYGGGYFCGGRFWPICPQNKRSLFSDDNPRAGNACMGPGLSVGLPYFGGQRDLGDAETTARSLGAGRNKQLLLLFLYYFLHLFLCYVSNYDIPFWSHPGRYKGERIPYAHSRL